MDYRDLVRDFAERTRANLDAIRRIQKSPDGPDVFEVTQLINSMLGLLVFPQQSYVNEIPRTPIKELETDGWPIPKVVGGYQQANDLQQLFRYLRNGIAHFNVKFLADGNGELRRIRLWNCRGRTKTWMAEIDIGQLEQLTDRFLNVMEHLPPHAEAATLFESSGR